MPLICDVQIAKSHADMSRGQASDNLTPTVNIRANNLRVPITVQGSVIKWQLENILLDIRICGKSLYIYFSHGRNFSKN